MSKRRWIAFALTFLGVLALAAPQYGVSQDEPKKEKGENGKKEPPRGMPGLPQPGEILPTFLQDALKFSEAQKKAVADLQKEVDEKLAKILNDDQKKMIKDLRERGPSAIGLPDGKRPGPGQEGKAKDKN